MDYQDISAHLLPRKRGVVRTIDMQRDPQRPRTAPPRDISAPRGGLDDLNLENTFGSGAYFRFLADSMDAGEGAVPSTKLPQRPLTAGWSFGADAQQRSSLESETAPPQVNAATVLQIATLHCKLQPYTNTGYLRAQHATTSAIGRRRLATPGTHAIDAN